MTTSDSPYESIARTNNAQNYNLNAPNINAVDHLHSTLDIHPGHSHWWSLCRQPANDLESTDHDTPFIERIQPVATSHPLGSSTVRSRGGPKTWFGLWLVFRQERWYEIVMTAIISHRPRRSHLDYRKLSARGATLIALNTPCSFLLRKLLQISANSVDFDV